jgi:hypothetical protein
MRRRLVVLNLVLLALAAVAAWSLRERWRQGAAEERGLLRAPAAQAPPEVPAKLAAPQPAAPAAYLDIAQRMLFASDRNPRVEVAVAAPKPLPPLPVAYGLMNMGDGPVVILAERAGAANRAYAPGESIGGLLLAAIEGEDLVFEWEGQQVRKNISELAPKEGAAAPAPAAAQAEATAQPVVQSAVAADPRPGAEMAEGVRVCDPNDTSPSGTVRDGYRKVITRWAFGQRCHWEPVQ